MTRAISLKKKIVFALIPVSGLFGCLESVCIVWERFDPPMSSMIRRARDLGAKGPNEFRVLFYGDSTVAGEPELSVGFVAQLKSYLEKIAPGKVPGFVNHAAAGQPTA